MAFLMTLLSASCAFAADGKSPADRNAMRFTDVSEAAGLAEPLKGAFVHAIAWGDFDDDGLLDVFVGTFADRSPRYGQSAAPPNMLFRQSSRGKFERFSCPPVEVACRCSGAAFADLDNDGDLDLYVSSNTLATPTRDDERRRAAQLEGSHLYRNDGAGKFVDISQESGACLPSLLRCRDVGVLDYNGDGLLDLLIAQDVGVSPNDQATEPHLFRNLGNLRFENVADDVGLDDDVWGAGLAVADLNDDRRPDFYVCGANRLYLSGPDDTYGRAPSLRQVFELPEKDLDWVTGASFGDLDRDGDLDLATGRHHYFGPSRIHVFLNGGLQDGAPVFREITDDLGLRPLPQKAPHPEIQDFDNDGVPDLYWSTFFADGQMRRPFVCRGVGAADGLPRFQVPPTDHVKPVFKNGKVQNVLPERGRGMVYYVCGPAVDYDSDGDLDLLVGMWPDEPSRLFRNDTDGGAWLGAQVVGKKSNRMGIGARVAVYRAGKAGQLDALLGLAEITVNGGYASSRPAIAHFGLGAVESCDVVVRLPRPSAPEPIVLRGVEVNRTIRVEEP